MTDRQPFLDPNLWDISEGENAVFGRGGKIWNAFLGIDQGYRLIFKAQN